MLIKLYPENPNPKMIRQIVDCLDAGGIIIYPTDTLYGIGCDIFNQKAVERIAQISEKLKKKAFFSFICYDLSNLSDYSKPIGNSVFKMMKRILPGPYTIILEANNLVPKMIQSHKKTVGIRVPDNSICRLIVQELGRPILSTSVKNSEDDIEYICNPELIYDNYKDIVDIVIDAGYGDYRPSTVIDCTQNPIEIIREGKGSIDIL